MPINAYVGLQGSGKTYEVVDAVIVPAVESGIRIVTNIHGLNADAIKAYIHSKSKLVVEPKIRVVTNDELESSTFFPYLEKSGEVTEVETIAKPGDLVIVDEAWRVWGRRSTTIPQHMSFFREHRHLTNEATDVSSNLVVIVQSIRDLNQDLRTVIERTFVMRQVKEFGQAFQSKYTVHQYEKDSIRKSALLNHWNKTYSKEVFALYKSYSAGAGREVAVDERQNLLKNPRLWSWMFLLLVLCGLSFYFLIYFFSGGTIKKKSAQESSKAISKSVDQSKQGDRRSAVAEKRPGPDIDAEWRVVGVYSTPQATVLVMRSTSGRSRLVYDVPNLRLRGLDISAVFDGKGYTTYSGGDAGLLKGPQK